MEPQYTPQPAPLVPPAPPAPPPQYVPPQQPAPASDQMAEGGIFKNMDWVQAGFMILGAFALFHIIDYYRRKVKEDKANQATVADLSQSMEKMQMNFEGMFKRLRAKRLV